jgi:hypothetical protein
MSELLSRRALLVGGSALAVMAACGPKNKDIKVGHTSTTQGQKTLLQAFQIGFNFQTGLDERVTFALVRGVPGTPFVEEDVHVAFLKPGTQVPTEPVVAERKASPVEQVKAYYLVHHTFDVPGNWELHATAPGMKPGNLAFEVVDPATVKWPVPGGALPRTPTPTAADPMGVNPICTRADGPCPFHAASLDAVAGKNGKPTIVLLATPALCQSATCGPVLDTLMSATEAVRDRLNIVHIEIYTDETGKTPSPAFSAFNLVNEPVCYFADNHGNVIDRFNGVFDDTEAAAAIQKVLA